MSWTVPGLPLATVTRVVLVSWDEFTRGLNDEDGELVKMYRDAALALDGVAERVHRSEVQYVRARIFTAGFIKSHRLEIAIDLLRSVEHPLLRASFPTTQRVLTHRFTVSSSDEFDGSIRSLLEEAYETVGMGTR